MAVLCLFLLLKAIHFFSHELKKITFISLWSCTYRVITHRVADFFLPVNSFGGPEENGQLDLCVNVAVRFIECFCMKERNDNDMDQEDHHHEHITKEEAMVC